MVSLVLTPEQHAQMSPLVRRQSTDRRGLLLASVAPFHTEHGETKLRLQVVYLPRNVANLVLKLIQQAENGAKRG
jgi:hypothetical protein